MTVLPAPPAFVADAPLAKALNVVGSQLVWVIAVGGAGAQLAWPGPVAAIAFVLATLRFGGRARADLRTLAIALPLGFALDSLFAASGWLVYARPMPWPMDWAAPLWIWALWASFAMTLNHSFSLLRGRPLLCALIGVVGGPLAYWSAAGAFGAVDFARPVPWVLGALALGWGLVLPLLVSLNARQTSAPGVHQ